MITGPPAGIIRKEKEIVEAFRAAGATGPDRTVTTASLGIHEGAAYRILRRRAVLREAGTVSLYLDEPAWESLRAARRLVAIAVILVLAAAIIVVISGTRRQPPTTSSPPATARP